MFQFSVLSSVIPYIALVVAYLFYLGACTFSKKEISTTEAELVKTISTDNNSFVDTDNTYDLGFELVYEAQTASDPDLVQLEGYSLKFALPQEVYRFRPDKSTITTRPPPVV